MFYRYRKVSIQPAEWLLNNFENYHSIGGYPLLSVSPTDWVTPAQALAEKGALESAAVGDKQSLNGQPLRLTATVPHNRPANNPLIAQTPAILRDR